MEFVYNPIDGSVEKRPLHQETGEDKKYIVYIGRDETVKHVFHDRETAHRCMAIIQRMDTETSGRIPVDSPRSNTSPRSMLSPRSSSTWANIFRRESTMMVFPTSPPRYLTLRRSPQSAAPAISSPSSPSSSCLIEVTGKIAIAVGNKESKLLGIGYHHRTHNEAEADDDEEEDIGAMEEEWSVIDHETKETKTMTRFDHVVSYVVAKKLQKERDLRDRLSQSE